MLNKTISWLLIKIGDLIVFFKFIGRLYKIVTAKANRKNKFTVNKILLLLRKEYDLIDKEKQTFKILRDISSHKIPKNIENRYIEYKNLKRFNKKVEKLQRLLYWIRKLDKTGSIFLRERFIRELYEDAVVMVQEKAKKTKGDGNIERDIKSLENISYFDLSGVYKETIKNSQNTNYK